MTQRSTRETKLNRRKTVKRKETLSKKTKVDSTEVINQEHKEIIKWFQTVKFRRTMFGGVDENDVWKKLQELNQLYESAIRAERERYNILLIDHEKTYGALIYKYKQELMEKEGTIRQTKMDNTEDEMPQEIRNEVRR